MVREAVDACRALLDHDTLSILDVGGYYLDRGTPTLPIARYLPHDTITVVDQVDCDLPGYIKGDGTNLDFADAHFDLVISADTLEHIPQEKREPFWNELLRTARHGVILLAPFRTPQVETAERMLFEYIQAELSQEQQQLKEHADYVLPELDEWLDFLAQRGKTVRAYPSGYLPAWIGMMLLKHMFQRIRPQAEPLVDWYYNQTFFASDRRRPAYRHMLVVEHTAGLADAVDAALAPTILPDEDDTTGAWQQALLPMMLALSQRQIIGEHLDVIHTHLSNHFGGMQAYQQVTNTRLLEVTDMQRNDIGALERILADQQRSITNQQRTIRDLHETVKKQQQQFETAIQNFHQHTSWLEEQNRALRYHLEAMQNGRVMRILNAISRIAKG
jgi:hypothetical protein